MFVDVNEFGPIVDVMNDLTVKSSTTVLVVDMSRVARAVRGLLVAIVNDAAAARADVRALLRAPGGR